MARNLLRVIGGLCVIAVSFLVTTYLLNDFESPATPPPVIAASGPCADANRILLPRPFSAWGGFAFGADIPRFNDDSDSEDNSTRSKLVLCEDGKPLGPPHSMHDDVRQKGLGRYSHWGKDVVFASSDNSDPNLNSRSYWIVDH